MPNYDDSSGYTGKSSQVNVNGPRIQGIGQGEVLVKDKETIVSQLNRVEKEFVEYRNSTEQRLQNMDSLIKRLLQIVGV